MEFNPFLSVLLTTQSIGHTVLSFYNVSSLTFIVVLVGTVCCYPAPKLQQKLAVTHSRSLTLIRCPFSIESRSHCPSLPLAQVQWAGMVLSLAGLCSSSVIGINRKSSMQKGPCLSGAGRREWECWEGRERAFLLSCCLWSLLNPLQVETIPMSGS